MKIAFVCDWLVCVRGAERCLEDMCEVYPQADIFTLVCYPDKLDGKFASYNIHTSFIQKLPGNDKTFRRYLPIFSKAIETFDFSDYDLVLSFSHCVAKSIIVPENIPHICYCYTPVRYAWDMRADYIASLPKMKRPLVNFMLNRLKKWDFRTASRPDNYIAISNYIRERIQKDYGLDSHVIYPPVDCSRFTVSYKNDDYYVTLSALVPYKRVDLAVKAFAQFDKKLIVIGRGSELDKLKEIATPNVEFADNASDEEVTSLLSNAKALIFPGIEDFGIVVLEAQACGKPVVAIGEGGTVETVVGMDENNYEDATGVFFNEQTPESLLEAVHKLEANYDKISPEVCRKNAELFGRDRYKAEMKEFVENYYSSK